MLNLYVVELEYKLESMPSSSYTVKYRYTNKKLVEKRLNISKRNLLSSVITINKLNKGEFIYVNSLVNIYPQN